VQSTIVGSYIWGEEEWNRRELQSPLPQMERWILKPTVW
jgi:hypothetical protein